MTLRNSFHPVSLLTVNLPSSPKDQRHSFLNLNLAQAEHGAGGAAGRPGSGRGAGGMGAPGTWSPTSPDGQNLIFHTGYLQGTTVIRLCIEFPLLHELKITQIYSSKNKKGEICIKNIAK